MEEGDFPTVYSSFFGLSLVLLSSQLQQCLLYARYLRSPTAPSAAQRLLLVLGVLCEFLGFCMSPLLLYLLAETGHLLAVTHYRKLIESRTGSCLEATASVLCASSLGYFLPSLMYMAVGLCESSPGLLSLDALYCLAVLGAWGWLKCCSRGRTMGKIGLTAGVHSWGLTLGRRVIGRYVRGVEVGVGLIGVGLTVGVVDALIAGRMVDRQTDEVMALYTFYLLGFLSLVCAFPALYQAPSPPHSLALALLALLFAFAVSARQGCGLLIYERGRMLEGKFGARLEEEEGEMEENTMENVEIIKDK